MADPTFNNLSLQDDTYITEVVNFRTRAPRDLQSGIISRRLGKKLTSTQIVEKVIELRGIILADSADDLQSAVDDLLKSTSKVEGNLVIESGRTYTATIESIQIPDRTFSQTIVPFEIRFVASTPFAVGGVLNPGFVIASGIQNLTVATTISGTVENRPLFNFTLPSGTGVSPINRIDIQNVTTANTVTISGVFQAESLIVVDYDNFLVTSAGISHDYVGQFDSLDPGSNSFIITVSGGNDGIQSTLQYNPRFW